MSVDHIVLDIEIQRAIEDLPGGWNSSDLMGVSVACVYEYQTGRFRVFDERRQGELRERINRADRITSFNGWLFDLPVVWAHKARTPVAHLAATSDDLLLRIWSSLDKLGAPKKGLGARRRVPRHSRGRQDRPR